NCASYMPNPTHSYWRNRNHYPAPAPPTTGHAMSARALDRVHVVHVQPAEVDRLVRPRQQRIARRHRHPPVTELDLRAEGEPVAGAEAETGAVGLQLVALAARVGI